jgi:hypothetical protein
MSIRNGWPAVSGAADQFDIRAALRATTAQDADGRIKTGCAVNAQSLKALVTPRQDMAVDLSTSDWILDRHGPIFLSVDGTETIGLDPAPSANSRIDTIWIKQQEAQSPIGDPSDGPLAGRTTGTPSISPTRPGIPDGALAIADVLVPSTATNTSSDGVIITQRAPYTAMQGGTLLFRNTTELDSFTPWDGQRARVMDVGEYVGSGGVWVSQSRIQSGVFAGQSDPNGYVSVTLPAAMPSAPVVLLTMGPTLNATLASYEELNLGEVDASHFTVHARNTTTGGSMGKNPVTFHWVAIWMG